MNVSKKAKPANWLKLILAHMAAGFVLFSACMIVIRLRMTELGYRFEELKAYERTLKEEQLSLRAKIGERLAPQKLKLSGFTEPLPKQVVRIP